MLSEQSKATKFRRGHVAYLRLRVVGFDKGPNGKQAAILEPVDKSGKSLDDGRWYYAPPEWLIDGELVLGEINEATGASNETG